jgi:hypothetical protein
MEWLAPWHSIAGNPDQVSALERELQRELAFGHPLYGLAVRAVGRRQDCDDVLFFIEDDSGRVAVVRLTWAPSPPDKASWPSTVMFPSLEVWITQGMRADHDEFNAHHQDAPA